MTPQATVFLAKAKDLLSQAKKMLGIELAEAAGRTAYLAGFHAAQAFIFERTGRIAKTHSGVHSEYARLTKSESTLDGDLRHFLGRGYGVKSDADYGTMPYSSIDSHQAKAMIVSAERFIVWNEEIISFEQDR